MGHIPMISWKSIVDAARAVLKRHGGVVHNEDALLQGDGSAERTVRILPHVTPSTRVPAASKRSRSVSFICESFPGQGISASYPSNGRRVSDAHGSISASRHSFPKSTCSRPAPFTRLHPASYPSNGRGACVRRHEQSASRHCSPQVPAAYLPRRASPGTHPDVSRKPRLQPIQSIKKRETGLPRSTAPRLTPSCSI